MKAGELVLACEELVKSYKSGPITPETHAINYFQEKKINNEDDRSFLQEVFYGCLQYKKLLKIPLSAFFFNHPQAHKVDQAKYEVILYLGLLRLDELGVHEYARLVRSQDLFKMNMVLSFVFDLDNVDNWLKDEWLKIYDHDLVYNQLINPLADALPELSEVLLDPLKTYVTTGVSVSNTRTVSQASGGTLGMPAVTKPQPFNLTKPRPRMVEPPQRLDVKFKARPVPKTTHEADNMAERIEQKVKEGHEERMKMYAEMKADLPEHLLQNPKVAKQEEAKRREKEEAAAARKRASYKAKPAPKFKPAKPVRLNTAAVLREDALYQQKQAAEMAKIEQYHAELRDASEFLEWQAKMKEKDDKAKFEAVKARKKAAEQAQLEAKLAMERKVKKNQEVVSALKAEDFARQQRKAKAIQVEERKKQEKRSKVKAAREGAALSQQQIKMQKKKAAAALVAKQRELEMKRAEEIEYERQRRKDLILQIKALEKVPKTQVKAYDPNERTDHGLLGDMSLTELKNRLELNKAREKDKVEEKRKDIIAKKEARQRELLERAKRISVIRGAASEEAKHRRLEKEAAARQAREEEEQKRQKEMAVLAETLRAKRESKDGEQAQLRAEARAVRIKNQFLSADHRMVEEAKWKELERGQERDAAAKQTAAKTQAEIDAQTAQRLEEQRVKNVKLQRKAEKQKAKEREEAAKAARVLAEEEAQRMAETKRLKAQAIREHEKSKTQLLSSKVGV